MSLQPLIAKEPSAPKVHAARKPELAPTVSRKPRIALFVSIAGIIAIGVETFFLVALPSAVNTYGRITPAHEWVLVKGTDGQLIASTFDYKTGLSDGYRVSNFNRGSSVSFSLRASLMPGQVVSRGDTIGTIYSSEMQERLIALNGELATTQGLLAVNASGEKAAIVNEAIQRLQFAKRRKEEHNKVLERSTRLLQSALISQGEFERVQGEANSLNDEIEIATANLEAARSGAKPEQLDMVHARIASLKNEIATIQRREATYTLTSPISGIVSRGFSADTLLKIADTTTFVALIPVKWTDYPRVSTGQEPRVSAWGLSRMVHGKVMSLNPEMQVLQGQKVVMATAVLEDANSSLLPGMLVKCRIECPSVTAFGRVKQFFSSGGAWSEIAGRY